MPDEPAELSIGESLIWVNYMFSTTERVAAAIPPGLLDWRPAQAAGGVHFSLAEIAMHIADARRNFAAQETGADYSADYYCPAWWSSTEVGDDELYRFKPYGSKEQLLASLKQARQLYAPLLALPLSRMTDVTAGSRQAFDKMIAELAAQGVDTAPHLRHGPGTIVHGLLAVIAHESGHRGSLTTLLRLNGVAVD